MQPSFLGAVFFMGCKEGMGKPKNRCSLAHYKIQLQHRFDLEYQKHERSNDNSIEDCKEKLQNSINFLILN